MSDSPTSITEAPEPPAAEGTEPPLDTQALTAARKRAKAETIGRYIAMFVMPLIMVGMMITGYLGTMASPTPRDMPIAITGSHSADFTATLADAEGDAIAAIAVSDATEARALVISREVSGAVVLDGTQATLYTATAAGPSQATIVAGLIAPTALAEGLTLTTEDLVPLPESDPAGLGAMFLATCLAMAGYIPFSMLVSNAPRLQRFRRVVPLLAGWAAVVAGLVWAVTGPILGVIASEHTAAVLGIAWLGVFAIGSVQIFLTRIFGAMAVIVGMLLLMVLGMPASNMAMSVHTMPAFYGFLHSFLPTPAIGEAMRSVLYFDGAGVWPHIGVLVVGALAGLGLTLGIDALRRRKAEKLTPVLINMPSIHGGERPKSKFWRGVSLFAFPFLMVAMMISVMLGAMSTPTPRDMPVAIVGTTTEQAEQTAEALAESMPGMFEYTVLDNADTAREMVQERSVIGAFILPSADSPEATVVTSQAAGSPASQVVTQVFTGVAAAQQLPVTVEDLNPLPARDANGSVSMYLGMGWLLAGFLIIVVGANAAPASRPLRTLIPIVAMYSAFMSTVLWLIAAPLTNAISGHFWALWGIGVLAIFSVAMFSAVLERIAGLLAVIPIVGIMMFLGVPASNGALSIYMEADAFRWLYEVLPMPAAVESVRSVLYFGGAGVDHHLLTFALWGIASIVAVAIIDSFKTVRTSIPVMTEPHYLLDRVPAK